MKKSILFKMKQFKQIVVLLVFCFYLIIQVQATPYWVSPTGTGNGLSAGAPAPITTVSTWNLVGGDVVNLAAGTYTITSGLTWGKSGTTGNPIVYQGAGSGSTIITSTTNLTILTLNVSNVNVIGIAFNLNVNTGNPAVSIGSTAYTKVSFSNCSFTTTSTNTNGGLNMNGTYTTVSNCTFTTGVGSSNQTYAITTGTGAAAANNSIITGCTFNIQSTNANSEAIYLQGTGGNENITISNNKFIGSGTSGNAIGLFNGQTVCTIQNNYISGFLNGIFHSGSANINNKCYYNSIYVRQDAIKGTSLSGWDIKNNIFVSTGNSSFSEVYYSTAPTTLNYDLFYSPNSAKFVNGFSAVGSGQLYAQLVLFLNALAYQEILNLLMLQIII